MLAGFAGMISVATAGYAPGTAKAWRPRNQILEGMDRSSSGSGHAVTISGIASPADGVQVLRTVSYENAGGLPTTFPVREMTFVVNDGVVDSTTATEGVRMGKVTCQLDGSMTVADSFGFEAQVPLFLGTGTHTFAIAICTDAASSTEGWTLHD